MNILEQLEQGFVAASAEETINLAAEVAQSLPPNAVLALSGDLGAGKTTFVKGLARAWKITATITSPTYNIFTIHQGPHRQLVHMDAYRLEGADAVDALMLEEFLQPPYCLVVEWPEKIAGWMPSETIFLRFSMGPADSRIIRREPWQQ